MHILHFVIPNVELIENDVLAVGQSRDPAEQEGGHQEGHAQRREGKQILNIKP